MTRPEKLGLGAVSLLLAFALGRFTTPERVVEKIRNVETSRSSETDAARSSETDAAREIVAMTRVDETTTKPDGTVTVTHTEKAETVREVIREVQVEVIRTVEVERVVIQERERLIESSKPAWRVALDLGVADAPHRVEIPGLQTGPIPVVAALNVERRIVGPVFLGAWISSTPGAGARLAVEF